MLLQVMLVNVVAASRRCSALDNDIGDATATVGKVFLTRPCSTIGDSEGHESVVTRRWVASKYFVDTALPVAQSCVIEQPEGGGVGDHVRILVADVINATVDAMDSDGSEFRKGIDGGFRRGFIVARDGEIQARAIASSRKVDTVVDELHGTSRDRVHCGMVAGIRSDEDDIACDSRTPDRFGVLQEIDHGKIAAVGISKNDGFVLGKVGRRHTPPLFVGGNMSCWRPWGQ